MAHNNNNSNDGDDMQVDDLDNNNDNTATPNINASSAYTNNYDDDDDDIDDTPLFVSDLDAVEVPVDDTHVPMDDDDDDDDDEHLADDTPAQEPIVDMARVVIASHTDPVYAVAVAVAVASASTMSGNPVPLRLVSGGGDDKAFWHDISLPLLAQLQPQPPPQQTNPLVQTTPLESLYAFKDSVSAVASNAPYIAFDTTKPPNAEWMAVGALDGSIVLFNPTHATHKVMTLEGPSSDIEWLCWHPKGGNVLLVGSSDATIWMYHLMTNNNYKCLQVFVGHEDAVTCGSFSADGKVALSGSADGTLRIWAPKTGKSKHVFRFENAAAAGGGGGGPAPAALTCLATHGGTDQQLVMVGSDDGQAHICHVANKKHVASLRHFDSNLYTTTTTTTNNNTMGDDDDDGDGQVMLPSGVEAVGFCKSNPNWCATGGMDGVLKIWDLANHGQCRHSCFVTAPAAQSTPPPPQQQQQQAPPPQPPRGDGITQLKWHPTLPLVVTSTCRGQVHLWDARNGQLLQTLTGHEDVINDMDVTFVPPLQPAGAGHAIVVTASDDKTVRIFDIDIDAVLSQHQ